MSEKQRLQEIVLNEYKRCLLEPAYFMRKYCKIQHPIRGNIPFEMFKFQEDTLNQFVNNRFNVVLKSRQTGISTLTAAYALWLILFHADKNVLVIATKQDTAKNLVTKVRHMHSFLPVWLRGKTVEDNKLSLRFANGSQIKATASSDEAGRSEALSLLIFDEAAFIDKIDSIWAAASLTLATGGNAIAISCVTADTMLFTCDGIIEMGSLFSNAPMGPSITESYHVLGHERMRSGTIIHDNGVVPTKRIYTKISRLEGSNNHKLWACSNGNFGWYPLSELSVGDWVNVQYGMNIWGNFSYVGDFSPEITSNHKNVFRPTYIDEDISYLMGMYIAEGSSYKVIRNGKFVGASITLTCGDDLSPVLNKLGLSYHLSKDGFHYTISSKTLYEFFEFVGFDMTKTAHQKEIPHQLMRLPKHLITSLISGIFDGDGTSHSNRGTVGISLSSYKLINQIQQILLNCGIRSRYRLLSKELLNSYDHFEYGFQHDIHSLELNSENSVMFYRDIGFRFYRKQANRVALSGYRNNNPHDVIPFSLDVCHKLFDYCDFGTYTLKELHGLNINGILNKSTRYKTEHISRGVVESLYDLVRHKLSPEEVDILDRIILPNSEWVQITHMQDGEAHTYDVSLPDRPDDFWAHSVVYNGILGHQTPNGMGNWFHKTWQQAQMKEEIEAGRNVFTWNPIFLHWTVHPERDQSWRDQQDILLGEKLAAQECDGDFISSGQTVIPGEMIQWIQENTVREPIIKDGMGGNIWKWKPVNYEKTYVVVGDVGRGDAADFSSFQVFEAESAEQVAEYRGKIDTKLFGRMLLAISIEYNNALLVIENKSIGWATIQEVIDSGYPNLFYMSNDMQYVDTERQMTNKHYSNDKKMVPGFTTSTRTRPLIINKLDEYIRELYEGVRLGAFPNESHYPVIIRSKRLVEELFTFIWHNGKAEHMDGYNDDLIIPLAIFLWVRDTALRLRQEGIDLMRTAIEGITIRRPYDGLYSPNSPQDNPWSMNVNGEDEDIKWLLG